VFTSFIAKLHHKAISAISVSNIRYDSVFALLLMLGVYQKCITLQNIHRLFLRPTVYEFYENLFSECHILVSGVNELLPVLSTCSSDLF
jgi:hypothetical protein